MDDPIVRREHMARVIRCNRREKLLPRRWHNKMAGQYMWRSLMLSKKSNVNSLDRLIAFDMSYHSSY